jgi:hypothetical protein
MSSSTIWFTFLRWFRSQFHRSQSVQQFRVSIRFSHHSASHFIGSIHIHFNAVKILNHTSVFPATVFQCELRSNMTSKEKWFDLIWFDLVCWQICQMESWHDDSWKRNERDVNDFEKIFWR